MNKSAYVAAKHGIIGLTKVHRRKSTINFFVYNVDDIMLVWPSRSLLPPLFIVSGDGEELARLMLLFMQVVALETAGTGVTCNAICPGFVLTPRKMCMSLQVEPF